MAWGRSTWLTSLEYAFQDPLCLYLVMDFHVGGDLLGVMERSPEVLNEQGVQFYLAEVAAGLNDLHHLGFIHRWVPWAPPEVLRCDPSLLVPQRCEARERSHCSDRPHQVGGLWLSGTADRWNCGELSGIPACCVCSHQTSRDVPSTHKGTHTQFWLDLSRCSIPQKG